jgi:hypothetical protein
MEWPTKNEKQLLTEAVVELESLEKTQTSFLNRRIQKLVQDSNDMRAKVKFNWLYQKISAMAGQDAQLPSYWTVALGRLYMVCLRL